MEEHITCNASDTRFTTYISSRFSPNRTLDQLQDQNNLNWQLFRKKHQNRLPEKLPRTLVLEQIDLTVVESCLDHDNQKLVFYYNAGEIVRQFIITHLLLKTSGIQNNSEVQSDSVKRHLMNLESLETEILFGVVDPITQTYFDDQDYKFFSEIFISFNRNRHVQNQSWTDLTKGYTPEIISNTGEIMKLTQHILPQFLEYAIPLVTDIAAISYGVRGISHLYQKYQKVLSGKYIDETIPMKVFHDKLNETLFILEHPNASFELKKIWNIRDVILDTQDALISLKKVIELVLRLLTYFPITTIPIHTIAKFVSFVQNPIIGLDDNIVSYLIMGLGFAFAIAPTAHSSAYSSRLNKVQQSTQRLEPFPQSKYNFFNIRETLLGELWVDLNQNVSIKDVLQSEHLLRNIFKLKFTRFIKQNIEPRFRTTKQRVKLRKSKTWLKFQVFLSFESQENQAIILDNNDITCQQSCVDKSPCIIPRHGHYIACNTRLQNTI